MTHAPRFAVLASGRGSNALALIDAWRAGRIAGELACVLSDRPEAPVVAAARARGVDTHAIVAETVGDRARYDALLVQQLERRDIEYVVLAGYMRICGPEFLARYGGRTINVHPSLLPAFPGIDAIGQALAAGVEETGVTVHFIDAGVDSGPVICQQAVSIEPGDSHRSLALRIHAVEHELLPLATDALVRGLVTLAPDGGSVAFATHSPHHTGALPICSVH